MKKRYINVNCSLVYSMSFCFLMLHAKHAVSPEKRFLFWYLHLNEWITEFYMKRNNHITYAVFFQTMRHLLIFVPPSLVFSPCIFHFAFVLISIHSSPPRVCTLDKCSAVIACAQFVSDLTWNGLTSDIFNEFELIWKNLWNCLHSGYRVTVRCVVSTPLFNKASQRVIMYIEKWTVC